jgi:thioredoxin-like negative regulator of GroEL
MTLLQAQLYLQDGKVAQAIQRLEPLAKVASPTREVLILLLVAYLQAGEAAAIDGFTKRALNEGLLSEMDAAGVFLETGDAARAQTVLELAVAKKAPSEDAALMLAMVYVASGRKDDAVALRERLVAAAGEGGAALAAKIDEAIAGAQQEMESIAREEAAGGDKDQPGADGQ